MDGTLVETSGEKKEGIDIAYDGTWGYHPLVLSLANTGEILSIVNRSDNRPSHEGAAAEADLAIELCRRAGFCRIRLRGDTDFTLTTPVNTLLSNWAYMVMTSLAWNLKAWLALWPSATGSDHEQTEQRVEQHRVLRMEFKTFVNHLMRLPGKRSIQPFLTARVPSGGV